MQTQAQTQASGSGSRARACALVHAPCIMMRTPAGALVPLFDSAPQEAAGVEGSHVLERRVVAAGELAEHTFEAHVLLLPMGPRTIRVECRLDGRPVSGCVEPGRLRFVARGDAVASTWYDAVDALLLSVAPALFATLLGEADQTCSVMLASRLPSHQDDVLAHLMRALHAYAGGARTGGLLLEQTLLAAIIHRIAASYAVGSRRAVRGPALPLWKQKRLDEYIHDNLARGFSLKDLAAVAELSPCHLARAYRASTGSSLWHHVLECRARHALQRIASDPDEMLADVAAACGFESYAQFIAAFRQVYGLLPSEYRRSLKRH